MRKNSWQKLMLLFLAVPFLLLFVLQIDSFARVGGARSSGFRGSRTYSAPSRTAPTTPSAPSQGYQQPGTPYQQPGGGFFRGMMGGLAGGILGSMLFRGLGFGAGGGWGGGGIGLFDILLLAVILYLIYRFVKRRREQAMGNSYYQSGTYGAAGAAASGPYEQSYDRGYASGGAMDTEAGLRYIRQMDPSFDEARFRDTCMDSFFAIQGAWANRDMSGVKSLLTDEMYRTIQGDADRLKADKQINRLDNIAVRTTDITEAWQESGKDYITVRFYANLLDYTADEATGQVISGSKSDPVKFEEYWTFTRPVGANPWQLTAIQQAQ
jgi:predicted lipid-binding transport protein (Tim44 family)